MEFDTVINVKEIKERAAHIMNTVVDDYKNRYEDMSTKDVGWELMNTDTKFPEDLDISTITADYMDIMCLNEKDGYTNIWEISEHIRGGNVKGHYLNELCQYLEREIKDVDWRNSDSMFKQLDVMLDYLSDNGKENKDKELDL